MLKLVVREITARLFSWYILVALRTKKGGRAQIYVFRGKQSVVFS